MNIRRLLLLGSAIVLTIANSGCKPPSEEAKAIQAKAEYAKNQLIIAVDEGRDVSKVVPKLKRVKRLGEAGKLDEVGHLLDEAIADLEALKREEGNTQIFVNPKPVMIEGYSGNAMETFITHDGKLLFFNSETSDDPATNKNIFYAKRIDDTRFKFIGEVKGVNSDKVDGVPSMDEHGNFYFVSMAGYNPKNRLATVYSGRFKDGRVTGIESHPELSLNIPGWVNMDVEISKDGKTLYATQTRFEIGKHAFPVQSDFFVAHRVNGEFKIDKRSNKIFRNINSDALEYGASISADELEFFFARLKQKNGFRFATYRATRKSINEPFSTPERIADITGFAEAPAITDDGQHLYFHKKSAGRFGIYVLKHKTNQAYSHREAGISQPDFLFDATW